MKKAVGALMIALCMGISPVFGESLAPHGIMAFGMTKNFLEIDVLSLAYVSGFSAYFTWEQLESEENRYDFRYLDAILEKARKHNKIVTVGVFPGIFTPEWVYKKYPRMPVFSWRHSMKEDQVPVQGEAIQQRSPVPWDEDYLKEWYDFLGELSRRYAKHPNVCAIVLTGPAIRGITTATPLKDKIDIQRFEALGYSRQKMVEAWQRTVREYEKLFPEKKWLLGVAPTFAGNSDIAVAEAVADYLISRDPRNAALFAVFLNDTWFTRSGAALRIRSLLKSYKNKAWIGYQMAQSAARNRTWVEKKPIVSSLRDSLALGIEDGGKFIEIWHDDLMDRRNGKPNEAYRADVAWAASKL